MFNSEKMKDLQEINKILQDHEQRILALENVELEPLQKVTTSVKKTKGDAPDTSATALDFSVPIRAFIRKYAGGMSGPQKFVLLLAYLSEGERGKSILLSEVEKQWNRMKSKTLLGMKFNRFYPAQAKEKDWVESKKQGEYNLRPSWREIFSIL